MTRRYYTLRYAQSDTLHRAGDRLANAVNVLHIGQTEGCDVRLPNTTQYEDALWAVIVPVDDDGGGWRLIRTSPYREHEVRVNGEPVTYARQLEKGDRIAFEGLRQELTFDIREDDRYATTAIATSQATSRARYAWPLLFVAVVAVLIGHSLLNRPMTDGMIDDAKRSVYQLKVDSVRLLAVAHGDTTVLASCPTDIRGVAFLTTDSLLVTARHCIEPWLNIPDTLRLDTTLALPPHVRMALTAETHNALNAAGVDSTLCCVSYCSLWQVVPTYTFLFATTSDRFTTNKSRDLVMELGDYDHQYVWRSLSARPRRTDMMLGDIAWLKVTTAQCPNPKGTIPMASADEMRQLCSKAGRDIVILGSPAGTIEGHDIERARDELRRATPFGDDGYASAVLAHNGEMAPGFSGGPVLTKCGPFSWRVIGVVSVTDKMNGNRCYSVPITEVQRITPP